jgi:hypothetical protein
MEYEGFKPSAEDLKRRRKIKNGRRRILSLQPEKDEGRKPKMKAKVVNLQPPLLLRWKLHVEKVLVVPSDFQISSACIRLSTIEHSLYSCFLDCPTHQLTISFPS